MARQGEGLPWWLPLPPRAVGSVCGQSPTSCADLSLPFGARPTALPCCTASGGETERQVVQHAPRACLEQSIHKWTIAFCAGPVRKLAKPRACNIDVQPTLDISVHASMSGCRCTLSIRTYPSSESKAIGLFELLRTHAATPPPPGLQSASSSQQPAARSQQPAASSQQPAVSSQICLRLVWGFWSPRWPQEGPGWPQHGSKMAPDGPRKPQEGPRWPQGGSNMAPRWPLRFVLRLRMCVRARVPARSCDIQRVGYNGKPRTW